MIYLLLAVIAITLLIVLWMSMELNKVRALVATVPDDGNVYQMLRSVDAELKHQEATVAAMEPRLAAVEAAMPLAISRTGVVAYDAFDNIAGNQSRTIALLNSNGDGVLISLLVGRDGTLFFTKQVRGRQGVEPLSPEEEAAIHQAMGG
jgi:hypothetical protein